MVCVLAVVVLVFVAAMVVDNNFAHREALNACLAGGYPEVTRADSGHPWYCVKRVDGTDCIERLCKVQLTGCEGED